MPSPCWKPAIRSARAFYASVRAGTDALKAGIAKAGPPLDVTIHASGHAHIDVAWLWTLGQTRQKSARTFYNVLRNMEQFPDYHFSQSQPQLYEFMRQDQPALFESHPGSGSPKGAGSRWAACGSRPTAT